MDLHHFIQQIARDKTAKLLRITIKKTIFVTPPTIICQQNMLNTSQRFLKNHTEAALAADIFHREEVFIEAV